MNDGFSGPDPELLQLFDEARAHGSAGLPAGAHDEAFVAAIMAKVRGARRRRVVARASVTVLIVVLGAILAPYVAQATVAITGGVLLYYQMGCACAALIAWRIARRRFA